MKQLPMFSLSLFNIGLSMLFSRFHNVNTMYEGDACSEGEFMVLSRNAESFVRCQSCYMCPPGYGVTRECSLTTDTVCVRCPEGYFSDSSTREGGCQRCKPCMDMADTIQQCTPNSDRVCHTECPRGEYLDVSNRRCMPCSLCHPQNDVRVSENYQCLSQGMPREWSCEANITVVDEQGNIIDTFDTGDTYSFKAISLQRQNREDPSYNGLYFPPLEEYLANRRQPVPTSQNTTELHRSERMTSTPQSYSTEERVQTTNGTEVSTEDTASPAIGKHGTVDFIISTHGIIVALFAALLISMFGNIIQCCRSRPTRCKSFKRSVSDQGRNIPLEPLAHAWERNKFLSAVPFDFDDTSSPSTTL